MAKYVYVYLIIVLSCTPTMSDAKSDQEAILNRPLSEGELSGEQLKAVLVAFKDFDYGIFSKDLENYTVLIRESPTHYEITFIPKMLKSERGLKGGSATLGQTVKYAISKGSYKLDRKSYAR